MEEFVIGEFGSLYESPLPPHFGSSSFSSSESHHHGGGGNLEPDGANLYTKARNRPLALPSASAACAAPQSELGHICGHHHIPPGGGGRHVLGPVSQFPSSVRCGAVIDAMENTAQQNDESKRNLLGTTNHRHYRPQRQQQRSRFRTIATRNDPSFSPRRSREGGKKVLTSVKKREEGRREEWVEKGARENNRQVKLSEWR